MKSFHTTELNRLLFEVYFLFFNLDVINFGFCKFD